MTRISYDRDDLKMDIVGHAGAGEYGKDTVCAALSILAMTLEKRLDDSAELFLPAVEKSPGRITLFCRVGEEAEKECREVFDTVFAGFLLLAENYPQYVSADQNGEAEGEYGGKYTNE